MMWCRGRVGSPKARIQAVAIGLLETTGWTPAMVALDTMEKTARIRVRQAELNDFLGVVIKLEGPLDAVSSAVEAGRRVAQTMGGRPVVSVLASPSGTAMRAIDSPAEFNPLIQQAVVTDPSKEVAAAMNESVEALGFIETQGFTAVFDAIDTACKAARVEVVGKEKLGGGYVTVVIRGDVAAVTAAIEAGKGRAAHLGTLIAAHVIARPSDSVLSLLPQ